MLDKEFQYFRDRQDDLVKKYNGKIIVIVGEKVIGSFSTESEAFLETIKNHKPGTFLIQKCIPGQEAYRQTFSSRVVFV